MKSFEARGFWHLPDEPSRQVVGTLFYSEEQGLRLSLTGTLGEQSLSFEPKDYRIVHGVVSDNPYGKMFTLVECFQTSGTMEIAGIWTEEIRATRAFAARNLLQEHELRFDAMELSIGGLSAWLGTTGIQPKPLGAADLRGLNLEYRCPETLSFRGRQKPMTIEFRFSYSIPSLGPSLRESSVFSLRESPVIRITDLEGMSEENINKLFVGPLRNFFTMALDTPVSIEKCVVYRNDFSDPRSGKAAPIQLIYQPVQMPSKHRDRLPPHDVLFTRRDVEGLFEDILHRWFEFADKFRPFCDVYFGSLRRPPGYVEERFLRTVQCLELFYALAKSVDGSVRDAREAALAKLVEPFSGHARDWLSKGMPTATEFSFPRYLAEDLREYREIMGPLVGDNVEAFVDDVVTTRNLITHRSELCSKSMFNAQKVHWTSEKLATQLKVCILEQLGIPRDKVASFFRRNQKYSHLKTVG
jgi:hypothetical protein